MTKRGTFVAITGAILTASALGLAAGATPIENEATLPQRLSDAFVELFRNHPGFREIHAKGIVAQGTFIPTSQAVIFSRAPHFSKTVPVTVRFSDFSGVPGISSTNPNASPHGLAVKFHVGTVDTDIVGHSVNAFPASNGDQFLAFIKALSASRPGSARPTAIERYINTHPAARRFVSEMPPPPVSYATSTYHMINAFKFVNAAGQVVFGRYHVIPLAGFKALDVALVATRPPNYLADELASRLRTTPAEFDIMLQTANPEDPTNDGSTIWPNDRRIYNIGRLRITEVTANGLVAQRGLFFDPTRLIDGIELSDDPLPALRSKVYAISLARRAEAQH